MDHYLDDWQWVVCKILFRKKTKSEQNTKKDKYTPAHQAIVFNPMITSLLLQRFLSDFNLKLSTFQEFFQHVTNMFDLSICASPLTNIQAPDISN